MAVLAEARTESPYDPAREYSRYTDETKSQLADFLLVPLDQEAH